MEFHGFQGLEVWQPVAACGGEALPLRGKKPLLDHGWLLGWLAGWHTNWQAAAWVADWQAGWLPGWHARWLGD